jgi:hypothetical protein
MLSGNHRVDLISSHEPSQRQRSPTVEQPSAGLYESAVDHPRETPSNAEATHPGCVVVMFEVMRARKHRVRRGARRQGWRSRHRVSDAEGAIAAGAAVWTITGRGGYDSSRGGGCGVPELGPGR